MNNVSGYSPAPIYGQIPAVKSQMLFYTVGGYVLLITLNSAILNNVALLPMQNSPQCEYISLLQVRTVTLNVYCVKFYLHCEVMLCQNLSYSYTGRM